MKKFMMAVCFALLAGGTMYAQESAENQQDRPRPNPEMMAKRMAGSLMLDDDATAKFVPLYKEYMQELAECRAPRIKRERGSSLTDKEIEESILGRLDSQEKRVKVQKNYYAKFKEILTMRQMNQLYNRPDNMRRDRPQRR